MKWDSERLEFALLILGFTQFTLASGVGVVNVARYRHAHGSLNMGLFYVSAILCLGVRAVYFLNELIWENPDAMFGLTVMPAYFSCSVAFSQSLIYYLLYLKLNMIYLNQNIQDEQKFQVKEKLAGVLAAIPILGMPISFIAQYSVMVEKQSAPDIDQFTCRWRYFSFQLLPTLVISCFVLTLTTIVLIKRLKKVV